MRILITGSSGMLGTDLTEALLPEHEVYGTGLIPSRQARYFQADLTAPSNVETLFSNSRPETVFHTAAMTDVDGCESKREEALRANFEMTRLLTDQCVKTNTPLIFFSTDYIFSGNKQGEYLENDPPQPVNYYGETKLLAENYIQENARRYVIFRITWLFGLHGKSFPRTILEKARSQKKFEIVADQWGRPTYTRDVAQVLSAVLRDKSFFESKGNNVYHLCNSGQTNWAEFAEFILNRSGFPDAEVSRIDSTRLERAAKRPANSVLSIEKARRDLGIFMRPWQEAVLSFIHEFHEQNKAGH